LGDFGDSAGNHWRRVVLCLGEVTVKSEWRLREVSAGMAAVESWKGERKLCISSHRPKQKRNRNFQSSESERERERSERLVDK
jgi:hypothetical protein